MLYELEGFRVPEIATIAQIPLGTAASRLRRGRESFGALVQRYSVTRSSNSAGKAR